jgi:hypothetical protein
MRWDRHVERIHGIRNTAVILVVVVVAAAGLENISCYIVLETSFKLALYIQNQ